MKHRIIFPVLLAVLIFLGIGLFFYWKMHKPPAPLSEQDFVLAGVRPDAPAGDVLKILGEPHTKERTAEPSIHNNDYISDFDTWSYPGLKVVFFSSREKSSPAPAEPGIVIDIVITDPRHATARGVRVGDPASRVMKKYGKMESNENQIFYENGMSYLSFGISRGKVAYIIAGVMFD
ncbi:MAG: hypothetical protein ACM3WV_09960 [Bacillota bacterium]